MTILENVEIEVDRHPDQATGHAQDPPGVIETVVLEVFEDLLKMMTTIPDLESPEGDHDLDQVALAPDHLEEKEIVVVQGKDRPIRKNWIEKTAKMTSRIVSVDPFMTNVGATTADVRNSKNKGTFKSEPEIINLRIRNNRTIPIQLNNVVQDPQPRGKIKVTLWTKGREQTFHDLIKKRTTRR